MHKTKRLAMFTAANIDGDTYLEVSRTTGQAGGSEGEKWFLDPRISASFFIDQPFYSAWSTYFDRGHLTRRSDPTWGTPEQAARVGQIADGVIIGSRLVRAAGEGGSPEGAADAVASFLSETRVALAG